DELERTSMIAELNPTLRGDRTGARVRQSRQSEALRRPGTFEHVGERPTFTRAFPVSTEREERMHRVKPPCDFEGQVAARSRPVNAAVAVLERLVLLAPGPVV